MTIWLPYPYPQDLFADLPLTVEMCAGPGEMPGDPASVEFFVPPFGPADSTIGMIAEMPNLRVVQLPRRRVTGCLATRCGSRPS